MTILLLIIIGLLTFTLMSLLFIVDQLFMLLRLLKNKGEMLEKLYEEYQNSLLEQEYEQEEVKS